jgi:hypothetical protein
MKKKTMAEKEIENRIINKDGSVYHKNTGRFIGYDVGGGWLAGPWRCHRGHTVDGNNSGCPECSKIRP